NLALGGLQKLFRGHDMVVGIAKNLSAGVDQVADNRSISDDAGIVLGVGGSRGSVPELAQIAVTAHVFNVFLLLEPFGKDDEIDRLAAVVETRDAPENLLMSVKIEIFSADDLQDIADGAVVPKHAAQHAALGFFALRRETVGSFLIRRHGAPTCAKGNGKPCPGKLELS